MHVHKFYRLTWLLNFTSNGQRSIAGATVIIQVTAMTKGWYSFLLAHTYTPSWCNILIGSLDILLCMDFIYLLPYNICWRLFYKCFLEIQNVSFWIPGIWSRYALIWITEISFWFRGLSKLLGLIFKVLPKERFQAFLWILFNVIKILTVTELLGFFVMPYLITC